MQVTKIINGQEYTFEVFENEIFARDIVAQENLGFKITKETDFYITNFYKEFQNEVGENEKKHLGQLFYKNETDTFVFRKWIKTGIHTFNKAAELGVNERIFRRLRLKDLICFFMEDGIYSITVEKATKTGNYKNFKGSYNSELQFFIPIENLNLLKKIEDKKTKRKKKNGKK